jgi:hypothetical protein
VTEPRASRKSSRRCPRGAAAPLPSRGG